MKSVLVVRPGFDAGGRHRNPYPIDTGDPMTAFRRVLRRSRVFVLLVACGLVAALTVAAPATATTPGDNGRIAVKAYLDADNSTGAIFTIRPDGTRLRQLTFPATGTIDDQPDWSPDGSLIAFTRCAPDTVCALYTVRRDGTHLRRLSAVCTATPPDTETTCGDESDVAFLPDGHRVMFTRSTGTVREFPDGSGWIQHSDIVIRDLSGRHEHVVVRSRPFSGDNVQMVASPDGKHIAFTRDNSPIGEPANGIAVFIVRVDGTHLRRLTPPAMRAGDHPDWSPDGRWILFRSNADGDFLDSQFYLVHPDGCGLHAITDVSADTTLLSASFSPNGKRIVYARAGLAGQPDIFTMKIDGTDQHRVTSTPRWESAPDWGSN
jgi:TolB protein